MSLSACSNKCSGLRIATGFELFSGRVFHDWKAFFASLAEPILYVDQSIQNCVPVQPLCSILPDNDRNPQRLMAFQIGCRLTQYLGDACCFEVGFCHLAYDSADSERLKHGLDHIVGTVQMHQCCELRAGRSGHPACAYEGGISTSI
jgi:hypothetical protein